MYSSALLLTDPKLPSSAARRVHAGAQPPALASGAQDDLDLHALLQDLRGARPEPGVLAARPEHRDVRLDNAVRRRRGVRHGEQRARGAGDGAPRGGHGAATADDCVPPPTACAGASDPEPGYNGSAMPSPPHGYNERAAAERKRLEAVLKLRVPPAKNAYQIFTAALGKQHPNMVKKAKDALWKEVKAEDGPQLARFKKLAAADEERHRLALEARSVMQNAKTNMRKRKLTLVRQ